MGLIGLIQDLYDAHKDNQTFLQTRFGLGEDVLKPYKQTLDRWLWPDVLRNQDISVAKAKQAISSYRKAIGEPAGLAELMVFFCESAAGFCNEVGNQDEGYLDALVYVRTGYQDHSSAIFRRPRRPHHPAGPCAEHQPRPGLWRWRCHGLPAWQSYRNLNGLRQLVQSWHRCRKFAEGAQLNWLQWVPSSSTQFYNTDFIPLSTPCVLLQHTSCPLNPPEVLRAFIAECPALPHHTEDTPTPSQSTLLRTYPGAANAGRL
jgi:hypothetical protein